MDKAFDVAAYIWPAYTGSEPRSRIFWPQGMGEWQTVREAAAKYPGDTWPRRPLWGYVNEADPRVMEMQIDAAADHGVNVFIYDWYWYDERPFLEQCLNDGFLGARNNQRMRFYLMWANHDANLTWDKRLSGTDVGDTVVWRGAVDADAFEAVCRRLIQRYFPLPNYYRIDGKPVFMIYDLQNLIEGLGGVENTRRSLRQFDERCRAAGLGGVHLQLTQWGERMLNVSGVDGGPRPDSALAPLLGFESLTNYQFVHFTDIDRDYRAILREVPALWRRWGECYGIPYFPHVSVGWDNNPRFVPMRPGVVKGNDPAAFEEGLRLARAYVEAHDLPAPLITINSWNEWTETSYLEPDDHNGYGYLEAVRRVFPPQGQVAQRP